jgi:hypothetical protein
MKKLISAVVIACLAALVPGASGQKTEKPVLHGREWVAITGKPLAATAGALIFAKGGNAVDAACAMLGAVCTMYDVLSWGGETQALIYDPRSGKVIGLNALGVAPTGATAEFYKAKGFAYPPEYGPLSAVTPGTPGGLLTMLAEFGTMSLAEVLAPALRMAEGYLMDKETGDRIERDKRGSRLAVLQSGLLPTSAARGAPAGRPSASDFATLGKLVEGAAGPRGGKEGKPLFMPPTTVLQGRHRPRHRPRLARAGRARHPGRPGRLEGPSRRARVDLL